MIIRRFLGTRGNRLQKRGKMVELLLLLVSKSATNFGTFLQPIIVEFRTPLSINSCTHIQQYNYSYVPDGIYSCTHVIILCSRGWCKKNWKNLFLHSVFNTYDYAFLCLCTQSRHFDNSKMVNWVNLVKKLTKIQGKMRKFQ